MTPAIKIVDGVWNHTTKTSSRIEPEIFYRGQIDIRNAVDGKLLNTVQIIAFLKEKYFDPRD